jgi:SAM-dependent methyltransferase
LTTTGASAAAFDALAPRYDGLFSPAANPLVGLMRDRAHQVFYRSFPAGGALLELGCGTGEDTLALAGRGHTLVACDPAPAMLERAAAKLESAGRAGSVRFVRGGAGEIAAAWSGLGLTVAGAFSNFGPLNCEPSLYPLRRLLAAALPPGGRFVAVVLPRVCPLEIALFLARGQPRTAFRRLARNPTGEVEGKSFAMRYWGAADFDRALGAGFRRVEARSLGVCLPPLAFGPALGRRPRLLGALAALEDRISAWPGVRRMGDHIALVYERL